MFTLILIILLIISHRSLSRRLKAIESKIKEWKAEGVRVAEPQLSNSPVNASAAAATSPVSSTTAAAPASGINQAVDAASNRFGEWLKEDWLMKLGAFLFIVGFGWFVSYAFANNWIGPVGRISAGIIAGVIIMALGFWRMTKYPSQGAVFMGLGAGMAMLTIFAGRSIYGFFTPASAILFDFVIAAFVSFASYKFNVRALAYVAEVLAFATPLLTAGKTEPIFLFSYLLFVSVATLVLAGVTGWRNLITTSLVFVGLYSAPFIGSSVYSGSYHTDAPTILNFAYVFSLLYLFSGMSAVVKKGVEDISNELVLAVLNGLFLFLWVYNVADAEWKVLIFALWAVIFSVSSFFAFRLSSRLEPFYAYGSVAVAFIAAATAAQLSGATLVIAFTMEVMLLVITVFFLTNNIKAATATAGLFVVPMLMSLESISRYSTSQDLFSKDFFVLALLAIALIACGRIVTHFGKEEEDGTKATPGSLLVIFGTFYIGYILWQFIHILMAGDRDMATMTTLIVYTVLGLIAYFAGLYGHDMARKTYGMALLAFVVIRLIFIDVWNMELFGRVITFLAIGVLLMSTAFLTKRNKQHE